ncbi:hypothetical protein BVC80_645g7 [Macleaya cordata]|uniref:Uncharacterized protein n=1 Tax=Macleaya cordata TaxID=56857 RepID=A0A200QJT6_MACCD|nr:hypothetical protein BVC80_645g7 [Macleaya cordata]
MDQILLTSRPFASSSPSSLLNYIFMSTVNTAAKTLVSVIKASSSNTSNSGGDDDKRWNLVDHFRYMLMLMIWFTLWMLRVLMDNFPCSLLLPSSPPPHYILDGSNSFSSSSDYYSSSSSSSSFSSSSSSSSVSSLDLVLHEGFSNSGYYYDDGSSSSSSTRAIGRALSHIFSLMNEIPATSRKYQFAVAMADKIVDENLRGGHVALQEINRTALSSAFARTSNLLYRSLLQSSQPVFEEGTGTWTSSILQALPFGSFIGTYLIKGLRFCLPSFLPFGGQLDTCQTQKIRQLVMAGGDDEFNEWVVAEKLGQELLWITNKLIVCSAVDEALVQWSFGSGLASLSLTAHPRVQGFIVKITVVLLGELARGDNPLMEETPRQVKYRLLLLWLPLLCYASNGLSYPLLTGIEKAETERRIEKVISSLPASDQEIILSNWFQDYTHSNSDWPNLQKSYDQWCRSSRNLLFLNN